MVSPFWRHVEKRGHRGCWVWTGARALMYDDFDEDGTISIDPDRRFDLDE